MKRAGAVAAVLSVLAGVWWFAIREDGVTLVFSGALAEGDSRRATGEYYDEHAFEGRIGQPVSFVLASSDFDPYLTVVSPSGDKLENDDWRGSNSPARVDLTLRESGTYRVEATSFAREETGSYSLRITAADPVTVLDTGERVASGTLDAGDTVDAAGRFEDQLVFTGLRGAQATVDLRARAFDTMLIVVAPDGTTVQNDDHDGSSRRSLVSYVLPADGDYRVRVTSYAAGERGGYDVTISQQSPAPRPAPGAGPGVRVERGTLAAGDEVVARGGYVDTYTFAGGPGQRVRLELTAPDFDTYLMLLPPRGAQVENDDFGDDRHRSRIDADLTEPGDYRVMVTSFAEQEVGSYALSIDVTQVPAPRVGSPSADATVELAIDRPVTGDLGDTDGRLREGEFRDLYAFEATAGDRIVVEMTSSAFDTYLLVTPPDGETINNDDLPGRTGVSQIAFVAPHTGRYRISATSSRSGETGPYQLVVGRSVVAPLMGTRTNTAGLPPPAGRTFGVFVGISDYGGRALDLEFTANDARQMHAALVRGVGMAAGDGAVFVDSQATLANVRRAILNAVRQAGPDDRFVLFFSGHGDRVARTEPQPADPDMVDETVMLYDVDLTDDALNDLLTGLRARVSLIVLDSCFSGGFSKDVISAPRRMGLFSSHEDVTSGVAFKFRAGGYLAHFFAEAAGDGLADLDADSHITAIELSQYLFERFRSDVKTSSQRSDIVRTGTALGYQHLVVDRGGVGPYDVLFQSLPRRTTPASGPGGR